MLKDPASISEVQVAAREIVDTLERIAQEAKCKLEEQPGLTAAVPTLNTFNSAASLQYLSKVLNDNRTSYESLRKEPAIARVAVREEESGKEWVLYFCRARQGLPPGVFSYLTPVGSVASLPVGETYTFPDGRVVRITERAVLHPTNAEIKWDSIETRVEGARFGATPLTIGSLLEILRIAAPPIDVTDPLAAFAAREELRNSVYEGLRRSVITHMGLRDQPVLDRFQDHIFRLPLDTRFFLAGPPGSGKTTTLIRRLSQKRNLELLEAQERELLERSNKAGVDHAVSWIMFTPTELLSQYLKEAFARESVPASDDNLRTWADFSRRVARSEFRLLKSPNNAAALVLSEHSDNLGPETLQRSIQLFEDFATWDFEYLRAEARKAAEVLIASQDEDIRGLGSRLVQLPWHADATELVESITLEADVADALYERNDASTAKQIEDWLRREITANPEFLKELHAYSRSIRLGDAGTSADENETLASPQSESRAIADYYRALRALAVATASKAGLNKGTKSEQIISWLGDRLPAEWELRQAGERLAAQASLRFVASPAASYINGAAARYRRFRDLRAVEGRWYLNREYAADSPIDPRELDIILLQLLRFSAALLRKPTVLSGLDRRPWTPLRSVLQLYRNQVFVDEATDFSPIQLACMASIVSPITRSFFACGDFNQRLTIWGTASIEQLRWALPDVVTQNVAIAYRQSKQLNDLAFEIGRIGATGADRSPLPDHVDANGVRPALVEKTSQEQAVTWIADCIRAIERFVGSLPSIAVFVNGEDEVEPTARRLGSALLSDNIAVTACRGGETIGHEGNVRVFSAHHIKGLEFEAVFFISIDSLAASEPSLFDKYLYVGATRAATYFGMTCEDVLPARLEGLRKAFVSSWHQLEGNE